MESGPPGKHSCIACGNAVSRPSRGSRWSCGMAGLGEALAFVYGTRVLEQRYLFNKLRNVADKSREDLPGKEHRETRQQLIEQASAIYQAKSAVQARQRFQAWAAQWRAGIGCDLIL